MIMKLKNHIYGFSVLVALIFFFMALPRLFARVAVESRAGEIVLREASDIFDHDNAFSFELGDRLMVECKFFITRVFGRKTLWAGADVTNNSDTTLYFAYYAAFFDADNNLLGSASEVSMITGLKPGRKMQLSNCMIFMPDSEFSKIRTYRVTLYESETEIGRGEHASPDR